MGLKFLRDGMDSANVVNMYQVSGQPGEWNFFAHEVRNHIGTFADVFEAKFATAGTDWVQEVGLSEMAKYDQSGNDEGTPVFPYRLDFAPSSDVANLASNSKPQPFNSWDYLHQLKSVPAGSVLYDVYGWTAPPQLGGKRVHIGELQLKGKITTSKWGDDKLYLRHQKLDEDLAYQPGWKPYYASYKLGGKCAYQVML